MEISKRHQYLVLSFDFPKKQHRVGIYEKLPIALKEWGPSSRVSPIYGVREFGTDESLTGLPSGDHELIFLGPIQPSLIKNAFPNSFRLWLSLGLFNVLISTADGSVKQQILAWATAHKVRYEVWMLADDCLKDYYFSTPAKPDPDHRPAIAEISEFALSTELQELAKEYCTLMTSTLCRAQQALTDLVPDLLTANSMIRSILELASSGDPTIDSIAQGELTKANAGLSRFSSQCFSGSTPITKTECHYWTHSLLGTGTANLALVRLHSFMQDKFNAFRLTQRLLKINPSVEINDLRRVSLTDDFWYEDHLGNVTLSQEDLQKPLFPTFTYFSGRDGFKSTHMTLSAPLAAITACNSRRWSLMTLTHEISHILVEGCLGILYPNVNSEEERERVLRLIESQPSNWLEEISRYLVMGVASIEGEERNQEKKEFNADELSDILRAWYHEVQEIMAHVFDFLYFYRSETHNYIESIWLSWSVIPDIRDRVPKYVLRTLCAVMTLHLRRGELAEETTFEQVENILSGLKVKQPYVPYIDLALDCLKTRKPWLKRHLLARKALVAIARAFFFSEKAQAALFGEHQLVGHKTHTEGYAKEKGRLDDKMIDNPLRFVDVYTKDQTASVSKSLFMLTTITYNVRKR